MWSGQGSVLLRAIVNGNVKGDNDGTQAIWRGWANGRTMSTSGVTFYVKPIRAVLITDGSWKPRFSTERFLRIWFFFHFSLVVYFVNPFLYNLWPCLNVFLAISLKQHSFLLTCKLSGLLVAILKTNPKGIAHAHVYVCLYVCMRIFVSLCLFAAVLFV